MKGTSEVGEYKPTDYFEGFYKDFDINIADEKELWLIQWPLNSVPDINGQTSSLKLNNDSGLLGTFEGSTGKLYEMVSTNIQEPGATVSLPSSSECQIGKYYLVDSGYPNTLGYMAPFSDGIIRRHLPEFRHAPPRGMAEHFNKRHSSLRMKVEGAFGQLKSTWKVLKRMSRISIDTQQPIILACFTLHNFILMQEYEILILDHEPTQGVSDSNMFDDTRKQAMSVVRDAIALQILESAGGDASDVDSSDESE